MGDEIDQVSYGESGYHTFETEAEAKQEAREHYRRHLVSCIRGRIRENKKVRWRIALLLTGCILLAWRLGTIQATLHFGGPWHICIAVMATWPIYVFGVFECAKSESRTLSLAGHWETLTIHDQLGEMNDHNVSGKIDRGVNKVWDSLRYARGNNGGEILAVAILAIGTLGTWTICDLIRMAPALVAEVIVDGILIPAQPSLAGRIPASPWWKYTFANTALHFFAMGMGATASFVLWKYLLLVRAAHGGY